MTTDIEIVSNALTMLGDTEILSFGEAGSPTNYRRAQMMTKTWPQVRDGVLRAKHWNCCKKRALLDPDATAPAYQYKQRFAKPADWLRTIQVGEDRQDLPYRDEGGFILANVQKLPLLYVFKNTDPATYDALLVEVLTLAVAARVAYAITKSAAQQKSVSDMLREVMMRAGAVDGQDDGPEDLGTYDTLRARLGGA